MDKLERALREDAAKIRADISPQLDDRIRASLEGVTPVRPEEPAPRRRPLSMWWASSLTGVGAAVVVIVLLNLGERTPGGGPSDVAMTGIGDPLVEPAILPELSARAALMADPLEQELENLESDIRKARDAVRRDLRLDL